MDINIGIRGGSAPLAMEIDLSPEELRAAVKVAIASGAPLELTGHDGSELIVPAHSLGYVKIGKQEQHRVGFGFV